MPEKDKIIEEIIRQNMGRSRKGRIKITHLIQKKQPNLSASKIRRVYQNCGFSLNKRLKRRVKDNPANPICIPLKANEQWTMDFMHDVLENGTKIRTLNIVDHYNRKCLRIDAFKSIPSRIVIEILNKTIEEHGKPIGIRTDNGPEFTSKKMQKWFIDNDIEWVKIQKGKPQQNAIIERFNRTFREDILDAYIFLNLEELQQITNLWINDYNQNRPHQSLNYKTPQEYAA